MSVFLLRDQQFRGCYPPDDDSLANFHIIALSASVALRPPRAFLQLAMLNLHQASGRQG